MVGYLPEGTIEIGPGVRLQWIASYRDPKKPVGINIWHCRGALGPNAGLDEPAWCGGWVRFAGTDEPAGGPSWTVVSDNPLTLSPSIQCHCNTLHGFVRAGKWVSA